LNVQTPTLVQAASALCAAGPRDESSLPAYVVSRKHRLSLFANLLKKTQEIRALNLATQGIDYFIRGYRRRARFASLVIA